MLGYLAGLLARLERFFWVVVEDAAAPNPAIAALLNATGLPHAYLAAGPTRRKGHEQRNAAYELIKRRNMSGVVYNMDDDNAYSPALWNELRKVQPGRVGVFAVLMDESGFVERPLYDARGVFMGFDASWCQYRRWSSLRFGPRHFCIDMGGFAFDAQLLQRKPGKPWDYRGVRKFMPFRRNSVQHEWRGGESEFVTSLLPNGYPEDLQPLGNCGHDVLVFHNGNTARTKPARPPMRPPPALRPPPAPPTALLDETP